MPYRKPSGEKRRGGKESNSRSSSSGLVSPTDNAVRAVAEIPDLVIRGAHRSTPTLGPSPQDNIMKFWQAGRLQDYQRRGELEHSSTVEPAAEIEVRQSPLRMYNLAYLQGSVLLGSFTV